MGLLLNCSARPAHAPPANCHKWQHDQHERPQKTPSKPAADETLPSRLNVIPDPPQSITVSPLYPRERQPDPVCWKSKSASNRSMIGVLNIPAIQTPSDRLRQHLLSASKRFRRLGEAPYFVSGPPYG